MKTIQQIRNEMHAFVIPSDYFFENMGEGTFTIWHGYGYFHDGENVTTIPVWGKKITTDMISKYPYVVWYNR